MGESRAFSREDANLAELWIESASNSTLIPVMVTRHFGHWVLRGCWRWASAAFSAAATPSAPSSSRIAPAWRACEDGDGQRSKLGTRAIEVRVAGGVAQLSGRVQSEEEADRLIRLVR